MSIKTMCHNIEFKKLIPVVWLQAPDPQDRFPRESTTSSSSNPPPIEDSREPDLRPEMPLPGQNKSKNWMVRFWKEHTSDESSSMETNVPATTAPTSPVETSPEPSSTPPYEYIEHPVDPNVVANAVPPPVPDRVATVQELPRVIYERGWRIDNVTKWRSITIILASMVFLSMFTLIILLLL